MARVAKKIAIIGLGPAGMAAAIELSHFGVKPILFEQNKNGSLLKNAWRVENYLGICPGVSGKELLQRFQSHLIKKRIKINRSKVELLDIDVRTKLFRIETAKKKYYADYVIVATGTKPKPLVVNMIDAIKPSVFYEVHPLLKKRKKRILIVGAGDAAFDNAISLANSNEIIICNRTKYINALPILVEKATKHRNIRYFAEHEFVDVARPSGDKKLNLIFLNRRKRIYIEADYLLVAIGRLPQQDFYSSKLMLKGKKLIKEGRLFLAGDVKNDIYRQTAIAVGDGIKVAMQIFHDLKKNEFENYQSNR